eukprot:126831-Prymnesium_polylepis.1
MQSSSVRFPRRSFSHGQGNDCVRLVLMGHRPSCVPVASMNLRISASKSSVVNTFFGAVNV